MNNASDVLTIAEAAAQYTEVDHRQIYYACRIGDIKTLTRKTKQRKVGAPVKYRMYRRDFEQWLRARKRTMIEPPEGYVEVKVAATMCDVSAWQIYNAITKGQIEAVRHPYAARGRARNRVYVNVQTVCAWKVEYGIRRTRARTTT